MSLIAQRRNLDMRIVLTYPLGPLPWSLATPQGTLRKTNKSKLIQLLTHNVDPLDDVPGTAAYVIDMMSFVQKLPDTSHVLKYFGLCSIYDSLGPDVCSALPGMHALTGCDTVSAFVGKGKVAALKLVQTNPDISTTLAKLSHSFGVPNEKMVSVERFVCHLYGSKKVTSIDELRYATFCAKKGNIESQNLPPCQNTLRKHIIPC